MDDPLRASLAELGAALRARRLSALELMTAALARVDATRDTLNAVVAIAPRDALLAAARESDVRLARGEARPLEGLPLGVKDLENARGLPTSEGSRLLADVVADDDDVHVARLRAAGAIPLGKTNVPELGPSAITKNLLHGVTRNPWDLARTPGGSSGGSAAAIAGGVLPLVTASDGGGSIRIPASWTGCFGLKPSHGRVPLAPRPMWDACQFGVTGPLTRTVEDAALYLDVVAGPSPLDPTALPLPPLRYAVAVERPLPASLRLGLSLDLGRVVVQSDVAAAVEDAARTLERLGHRLVPVPGGPPALGQDWMLLASFELAARIGDRLRGREGDVQRSLLEALRGAEHPTSARWGAAQRRRADTVRWCADTFARCDLLLTPTTPYDPPPARGPFPVETEGRTQDPEAVAAFTQPFNLSWHPAASVRVARSRAGLPVGMQIVGPHHRDDLVLQLARAFERRRPWHPDWPRA